MHHLKDPAVDAIIVMDHGKIIARGRYIYIYVVTRLRLNFSLLSCLGDLDVTFHCYARCRRGVFGLTLRRMLR